MNKLLKNTLLLVLITFIFCCEKEQNSLNFSINYDSSFSTEPRPITITIDKNSGHIYLANEYRAKIQKFDLEGKLLKTIIDFSTFNEGKYLHYEPRDMCMDNNRNLFVLVKPYQPWIDETWFPLEGFCILQFDVDDNFQKEFDFTQGDISPSVISYSNKYLFVTNGRKLKKILIESEQTINITLPFNEEDTITRPDIHTTDMEIDSKGIIYLVGQAAFPDTSLGCHITKINSQINERITYYSQGRTVQYYAMLNNPGLTLDSDGNIYLSTFYCMSLEIFNKDVEFIKQIDIQTNDNEDTRPIDVDIYNNQIYILDELNDVVLVYKRD